MELVEVFRGLLLKQGDVRGCLLPILALDPWADTSKTLSLAAMILSVWAL